MSHWTDAVNRTLIDQAREAEAAYNLAKEALSEEIMRAAPFQKNDVVRDKQTGNLYRIARGSGYLVSGRCQLHLIAYRVYKSGRREATSSTSISYTSNYEKVTEE